jgi:hypothetical protein
MPKTAFTPSEWKKKIVGVVCKVCKEKIQCGKCQRRHEAGSFSRCQSTTPSYMKNIRKRRCNECIDEFAAEESGSVRKSFRTNK